MILRNLITIPECEIIYLNFMESILRTETLRRGQVIGSITSQTLGKMDVISQLIKKITPIVSNVLGKKITPTGFYSRKSHKGQVLYIHTDAKLYDISLTIPIAVSDNQINPLVIHKSDGDNILLMKLGDGGLIIDANKTKHSRPPIRSDWICNIFFQNIRIPTY